jgi:hypothetical protein
VNATAGSETPTAEPSTAVFVDVGGDVGALVLSAPASLSGLEVEIERTGEAGSRTHVYVLARRTGRGVVHAAVFPSLAEGRYTVFGIDGRPDGAVVVRGGEVTEASWVQVPVRGPQTA